MNSPLTYLRPSLRHRAKRCVLATTLLCCSCAMLILLNLVGAAGKQDSKHDSRA
jgi:hypothetical protein